MKTIATTDAPAAIGPYCQAIHVDGLLFASGQIPLTAEGQLVEGDVQVQARQVFSNIRAVLAAAGATLNNVVKATVYVQDLNDFALLNAVYAEAFGDHKPARSTVQVARLPLDAKVEIEVIAKL
ncbi:RidA family protein [Sedimenticola selenatireducens]|jgi:2-iminobutanoate/2-iminopropanoate deaminase|uniref:RidA family protein n=1 Tax=Sedimenticola selenatireducens TaxID=191960 RepID=A0A558DPX7_9GAMM|nr:RidA family protein [Sedimenticola selenatireducens]TVO70451.1 RidA family protein [Sedimenticola selenatireducens]TVT63028.1 MAG: RidA family protein [Sedimenticola selenatireducens]